MATINYSRLFALIQGRTQGKTFKTIEPGNFLYEIVETSERLRIISRKVKTVRHVGKKTYFTLMPIEGIKQVKGEYCPYSNKKFTFTKKFNPIFTDYGDALHFTLRKLEKDMDYYERIWKKIHSKYQTIRTNAAMWEGVERKNTVRVTPIPNRLSNVTYRYGYNPIPSGTTISGTTISSNIPF